MKVIISLDTSKVSFRYVGNLIHSSSWFFLRINVCDITFEDEWELMTYVSWILGAFFALKARKSWFKHHLVVLLFLRFGSLGMSTFSLLLKLMCLLYVLFTCFQSWVASSTHCYWLLLCACFRIWRSMLIIEGKWSLFSTIFTVAQLW